MWIIRRKAGSWWNQHPSNAWNEKTVVRYQEIRLFHIHIIRNLTPCEYLPGYCKQGNESEKREL
jgi:hypothetical protein